MSKKSFDWEMLIGLILVAAVIIIGGAFTYAYGQTPDTPTVCIYHPETLMKTNPAGRPVIIQVRGIYGTTTADGLSYIRREWASDNPFRQEAAIVAAVMYSIALHPLKVEAAKQVPLASYFPSGNLSIAPSPSLYKTWFTYMFTGNTRERNNSGYLLGLVANSRQNIDCNPYHPYPREW